MNSKEILVENKKAFTLLFSVMAVSIFIYFNFNRENNQVVVNTTTIDLEGYIEPEIIDVQVTSINPVQIKDYNLQESRFKMYEAGYQSLVSSCRDRLGISLQFNIDVYMLALINNTHIGETGGIKLVYSPGFDYLFSEYGFTTQQEADSPYAQVCVGYDILQSTIRSNNSIISGFAEYNGGMHASIWWTQYMSYLGSDGELQLIRSISSGSIPFDVEYLRLKQEYISYLNDQGLPGESISQRVETFVIGSVRTIYPSTDTISN